jgi:hypothetical protein
MYILNLAQLTIRSILELAFDLGREGEWIGIVDTLQY